MLLYIDLTPEPESPTASIRQDLNRLLFKSPLKSPLRSPVKMKYSLEEEKILKRLIMTDDVLKSKKGLLNLMQQEPFNRVPEWTIVSLRTKIADMKKKIKS